VLESLTNFFGGPLPLFYGIALIASVLLVVQVLLTFFGFDDFDADGAEVGSGIITLRSLTGFFGGFGWTAVLMIESGFSPGISTLAGVLAGLVLMLSFAYLMRLLYSLRESGNVQLETAVGKTGTVYVSIPADSASVGQIQIMVQGRLQVVPATTHSGERIPSGGQVRIIDLIDGMTLLVEPVANVSKKES
jgi:membrane protein implicated in regulation of membrane protease activity